MAGHAERECDGITHKSADERLESIIDEIKEPDIRTILRIADRRKMSLRDCITSGGIEKLARYIISLEKK